MERMSVKQRKETKAKKRKHLHEMRTRKIAKYDLWGDEGMKVNMMQDILCDHNNINLIYFCNVLNMKITSRVLFV